MTILITVNDDGTYTLTNDHPQTILARASLTEVIRFLVGQACSSQKSQLGL